MGSTILHFESNFGFLEKEFPLLANLCTSAEYHLHSDPVVCIIKIRQFGELLTELLFSEHALDFPYDDSQHNRLKTLDYEGYLPSQVKDLLFSIKNKGNIANHQMKGSIDDAKTALLSAFKISKWLVETYGYGDSVAHLRFSPPPDLDARHALNLLEKDYQDLENKFKQLNEERKAAEVSKERQTEIRRKSKKAARKIEMSEAETRVLIDEQLRQAGWEVDTNLINYKTNKSLPQKGRNMAIAEWAVNGLWADYALFIGLDLFAFVEAKKYANDISTDLHQAKIYSENADIIGETLLLGKWGDYKVPFLFATNGRPYLEQIKTKSGIWFLDVRKTSNHSRSLKAWFSPDGLKKLFEQNIEIAEKKLIDSDLAYLQNKNGLGLRDYQIEAIKAVENKIINDSEDNKALLAMATGTGKTRTIMGLCYRLIKANRFNRILFLVDRRLLATQSFDSFKDNKIEDLNTFSDIYSVDSLKVTIPDMESRLHFATVQGMVKRLFYSEDNKLTIDAYDCIIIDEAHRGYLQDKELDDEELNFKDQRDYVSKYRMVLDYFDAFKVGLTATPALHTKEIFGAPVYSYSYREAVIDGFLIDHEPPFIIKTKLSEEGIVWKKGEKPKVFDKEHNKIISLDELEDELKIEVSGFNKSVITPSFNKTIVKQLAKELDPESEDKTLIFAATDEHADLLVDLLKEEFVNMGLELSDNAIQKITGKSYNPQELLTRYKNEKNPNIAVTVDLLSTGIDVPEICNIVFVRRIRSRILYEQMLGRATRLCPEIGKETFRIYDAVRVYETLQDYTDMKPVSPNPKATFTQLVEEITQIDSKERLKKQLEQIIAKLQRKRNIIEESNLESFQYNAGGNDPENFIIKLKNTPNNEIVSTLNKYLGLWKYLDELKSTPRYQLVSEHEDEYLSTERGYGKGQKPEDYIDSFKQFINENINKIPALQIICSRPKELDRKSLKELRLLLNQEGFNTTSLNTAWKNAKNEDIAADIISFIRTLAVGSSLISHEQRVRNAVEKVRRIRDWNRIQMKWIDRFEKQLLQETIIKKEDIDRAPFDEAGGFKRLNKIFEDKLSEVLNTINEELYTEIA